MATIVLFSLKFSPNNACAYGVAVWASYGCFLRSQQNTMKPMVFTVQMVPAPNIAEPIVSCGSYAKHNEAVCVCFPTAINKTLFGVNALASFFCFGCAYETVCTNGRAYLLAEAVRHSG